MLKQDKIQEVIRDRLREIFTDKDLRKEFGRLFIYNYNNYDDVFQRFVAKQSGLEVKEYIKQFIDKVEYYHLGSIYMKNGFWQITIEGKLVIGNFLLKVPIKEFIL